MLKVKIRLTVLALSLAMPFSAFARNASWTPESIREIEADLRDFNDNSNEFMERLPRKWDRDGNPIATPANSIREREIIDWKADNRENLVFDSLLEGRSGMVAGEDDVESFVDREDLVANIYSMEDQGLSKAQTSEQPWSDHYWPIYEGILGNRYDDPNFPANSDWKKNFDYIFGKSALDVFNSGDIEEINLLSPAEKYDLIVGDAGFLLTQVQWKQGRQYYDQYGKVEGWMGICHGWAPASFMYKRPQKKIEVPAADGETMITFYPSDIKALASLMWATSRTSTSFLGGRCTDKDPKKDEVGRIISPKCFDTNPGTWHQTVVNQIGKEKKSLVLDATYDYEVWNQPLLSYSYTYFNPQTLDAAPSAKEATVTRDEFTNDKFKKYRAPDAKKFVGIAMEIRYVVEVQPSQEDIDAPTRDAITRVRYLYDLELDADGIIIGGEWYSNKHPDFLWKPSRRARALSSADYYILSESWESGSPVPQHWRKLALNVSKNGQPIGKIVEALIQMSQNNQNEVQPELGGVNNE